MTEAEIVRLYQSGVSQRCIGRQAGITQSWVSVILKRLGIKCRSRTLWSGAGEISGKRLSEFKKNARERNLQWDVSPEYLWSLFLNQERRCKLTGELLSFGFRNRSESCFGSTASLDRIDPTLGYVRDNVQWIHKIVNEMKWDKTEKELLEWATKLVVHNRRN